RCDRRLSGTRIEACSTNMTGLRKRRPRTIVLGTITGMTTDLSPTRDITTATTTTIPMTTTMATFTMKASWVG
ncbi:MAG: hypothetical protein ACRDIE_04405, partial [Chloroflexota bacterium]